MIVFGSLLGFIVLSVAIVMSILSENTSSPFDFTLFQPLMFIAVGIVASSGSRLVYKDLLKLISAILIQVTSTNAAVKDNTPDVKNTNSMEQN